MPVQCVEAGALYRAEENFLTAWACTHPRGSGITREIAKTRMLEIIALSEIIPISRSYNDCIYACLRVLDRACSRHTHNCLSSPRRRKDRHRCNSLPGLHTSGSASPRAQCPTTREGRCRSRQISPRRILLIKDVVARSISRSSGTTYQYTH